MPIPLAPAAMSAHNYRMKMKVAATGIAIVGLLALGTAVLVETAPTRAESISGDAQKANHQYLVGVTGMT